MDDVIFPRAVGLVLRLWDEISGAVYARLAKFRYFLLLISLGEVFLLAVQLNFHSEGLCNIDRYSAFRKLVKFDSRQPLYTLSRKIHFNSCFCR